MICKKCGESQSTEFYLTNRSTCKKCLIEYAKQWDKEHPEVRHRRRQKPSYKNRQRKYYRLWYRENGRDRAIDYVANNLLWQKAHPEAGKTARMVRQAIRDGKMTKPLFCSGCGRKGKVQGHHPDYSKPLDVIWLCASCHKKVSQTSSLSQVPESEMGYT